MRGKILSILQVCIKLTSGLLVYYLLLKGMSPQNILTISYVQNVQSIAQGGFCAIFTTGVVVGRNQKNKDSYDATCRALSRFGWYAAAGIVAVGAFLDTVSLIYTMAFLSMMATSSLVYQQSLLLNEQKYKEYNVVNIVYSAVTLAIFLVGWLLVEPDILPWVFAISPVASLLLVKRSGLVFFNSLKEKHSISLFVVKRLIKYVAVGGGVLIAYSLTQILIRQILSKEYGGVDASEWSVVSRLSDYYLGLINALVSMYLLPKIKNNEYFPSVCIVKKVAIVALCIVVGYCTVAIQFMRYALDSSLAGASIYIKYQIFMDFIRIISWFYAFYFLGNDRLKIFACGEMITYLTYMVIGAIFSCLYGVHGAIVGGFTAFLAATIFYAGKYYRLRNANTFSYH